jgi:hypothetical protein
MVSIQRQLQFGRQVLSFPQFTGLGAASLMISAETSQLKWRGKLVILEMMMNIAGYCIVNWINYGLSFAGGAVAWRFPLAFQFFFFFILWSSVPWLPESPR